MGASTVTPPRQVYELRQRLSPPFARTRSGLGLGLGLANPITPNPTRTLTLTLNPNPNPDQVQRRVDRVTSRFFHLTDLIARNAMAAADSGDSAAAAAQSLHPARTRTRPGSG